MAAISAPTAMQVDLESIIDSFQALFTADHDILKDVFANLHVPPNLLPSAAFLDALDDEQHRMALRMGSAWTIRVSCASSWGSISRLRLGPGHCLERETSDSASESSHNVWLSSKSDAAVVEEAMEIDLDRGGDGFALGRGQKGEEKELDGRMGNGMNEVTVGQG
ncbi:hypothetical protein C8J56DRAFT_940155 [Mycena floridula]|nr:hypothetical protein C8J56DRAFT_940155 [Mycena floridula]